MINFDWSSAGSTLAGFGGEQVTLHVLKSGLPYFDVLCLYGAIDLYIGLREDVIIHDEGNEWKVTGRARTQHIIGRDEKMFRQLQSRRRPGPDEYCSALRMLVYKGQSIKNELFVRADRNFSGFDSVLQSGIRGISAYSYETLQTAQTSKSECKADIPLSQGLLAFVGEKRTQSVGNIRFLPVFEGRIDLSKVVSPVRAWLGMPNVLCSQALALLSLKSALFSEGYQGRLSCVVFNTSLGSQRSDNYSGMISIKSTAIGKLEDSELIYQIHRVFRRLVSKAWNKQGRSYKATAYASHALAMAYWLMQPVGKHLSSMITSQEWLKVNGYGGVFTEPKYVKEVFQMSCKVWKGDHEAVRKFAKAVASSIKWARGRDNNGHWLAHQEQRKNWYDEVVMLRSAPNAKAFRERALILLEQGHREHGQVGTIHRDEAFDPSALFASIGEGRDEFEIFRDLFRMYLIQESTYKTMEEQQ